MGKQVFAGCAFDELPQVHDGDVIAHVADDAQVVRDEQVSQTQLFLQPLHQIQDLCLNGHIECRHGFITNQQFGSTGQGAGQGDALALATRELVWEQLHLLGAQTGLHEQRAGQVVALGGHAYIHQIQCIPNRLSGAHPGVERGKRVLEHHLKALTLQPQGFALQCADGGVAQRYMACSHRGQAHHGQGGGAFTRATFAHDAKGTAALDLEAHAIHRLEHGFGLEKTALEGVMHLQITHLQQGVTHARVPSVSG